MAQFDRIYIRGRKNHFDLVPKIAAQPKEEMKKQQVKTTLENALIEEEEEEDEQVVKTDDNFGEDLHLPTK